MVSLKNVEKITISRKVITIQDKITDFKAEYFIVQKFIMIPNKCDKIILKNNYLEQLIRTDFLALGTCLKLQTISCQINH